MMSAESTTDILPTGDHLSLSPQTLAKDLFFFLVKNKILGVFLMTDPSSMDKIGRLSKAVLSSSDIVLIDFSIGFPYLSFWLYANVVRPVRPITCKNIYLSERGIQKVYSQQDLMELPLEGFMKHILSVPSISKIGYLPPLTELQWAEKKKIYGPLLWTIALFALLCTLSYYLIVFLFQRKVTPHDIPSSPSKEI